MALGDFNNTDNNKKKYSVNVYSAYTLSNSDSQIDSTRLSATFFNKMLKLTLDPKKEGSSVESPEWDTKAGISVYLTHTKARMLYDEICMFQKRKECNNAGVTSGSGLISISNGRELGIDATCLIIRKLNGDSGEIESSYAYEFKKNYHYAIENFNQENLEFDKVYHEDIEIEQFKTLLKTYYEAMSSALAYSMMDSLQYDNSRINTKLDSICEKLGIEYKGKQSNKSSNSVFNSKEPRNSFSAGTIDDIAN